jgi:hypothetical protein
MQVMQVSPKTGSVKGIVFFCDGWIGDDAW